MLIRRCRKNDEGTPVVFYKLTSFSIRPSPRKFLQALARRFGEAGPWPLLAAALFMLGTAVTPAGRGILKVGLVMAAGVFAYYFLASWVSVGPERIIRVWMGWPRRVRRGRIGSVRFREEFGTVQVLTTTKYLDVISVSGRRLFSLNCDYWADEDLLALKGSIGSMLPQSASPTMADEEIRRLGNEAIQLLEAGRDREAKAILDCLPPGPEPAGPEFPQRHSVLSALGGDVVEKKLEEMARQDPVGAAQQRREWSEIKVALDRKPLSGWQRRILQVALVVFVGAIALLLLTGR